MGDIRIMEKPDWISFDDIHELLYAAHESNRRQGFDVDTARMSADRLQYHLGDTGRCFVALDGDKLVGTCSYRLLRRNTWYAKGDVVDLILLGVLPEYKRQGVSRMLHRRLDEEALASGCTAVEARTSEGNTIVRRFSERRGFKYVGFLAPRADHYTVVMMKWLGDCPFSDWYIWMRYQLKKAYVKLRYKPGKIKRFL